MKKSIIPAILLFTAVACNDAKKNEPTVDAKKTTDTASKKAPATAAAPAAFLFTSTAKKQVTVKDKSYDVMGDLFDTIKDEMDMETYVYNDKGNVTVSVVGSVAGVASMLDISKFKLETIKGKATMQTNPSGGFIVNIETADKSKSIEAFNTESKLASKVENTNTTLFYANSKEKALTLMTFLNGM